MAEVAQVVSRRCDAPLETVRVILREVPAHHWSVGGVPKGEFPET
jgi:phenylpyruvate tautomerase PptA (4-oxalocrotonate tautomerase family)